MATELDSTGRPLCEDTANNGTPVKRSAEILEKRLLDISATLECRPLDGYDLEITAWVGKCGGSVAWTKCWMGFGQNQGLLHPSLARAYAAAIIAVADRAEALAREMGIEVK